MKNRFIHYLMTLSLSDYQKLLVHFLPSIYIDDDLVAQFVEDVFFEAKKSEYIVLSDPHGWLEKKAEEFCTPDINEGYKFNLSVI